mgnify:CR=1 FL=1
MTAYFADAAALIGRTPLKIINPKGNPFVAIDPGDQLRFKPITPDVLVKRVRAVLDAQS